MYYWISMYRKFPVYLYAGALTLSFATFVPSSVFAQTSVCSSTGYTVIFVNGILNTETEAEQAKETLKKTLPSQINRESVAVRLGYNESHLGGGGDLYKSIQQAMQKPAATVAQDYDLKTILMQIQPQVTTRKILLVGHSQGTFYTNSIYRYLLESGVPEGSMAIYNLASPDSYVEGAGTYLTSANDKLIRKVRDWAGGAGARAPLPDNIRIPLPPGEEADDYGGHHFASSYLNQEPDRIVGDISKALAKLKAGSSPATDGCFTPPPPTLSYKAAHVGFALGDPTVGTAMTVVAPAAKVLAAATQKAYAAAAALTRVIGGAFTNLMGNPQVSAASQGAATASAFTQSSPPPPPTPKPVSPKSPPAPKSTAPTVSNPPVLPIAPPPPPPPPVASETLPPAASPDPAQTPPAPPPDTSAQQALQSVGGSPTQSPPPTVVFVPLAVSSPSDGASYATSSATFTGTTTAGFVIALTYGSLAASATADTNGDWSATLELPEGITVVGIVAADAEGNTSDAATRTLTVDTTPPLEAPTVSIVECLVPAGEYCAWLGLIVNLQWNAISDTTHYAIAKNGIFDSTTTDTAMEFRLEANATTTFAVAAYYASGGATSTDVSVFTFLPEPPPGFEM